MKTRASGSLGSSAGSKTGFRTRPLGGGGGGGGVRVNGRFDSLWLREGIPVWVHISETLFAQKVWSRAEGEVVDTETTWFESARHYIPRNKQSLICSAGPYKDKPCYPCSIVNEHWAAKRAEEALAAEENREPRDLGNPSVNRSNQYSLAITTLEDFYLVKSTPRESGGKSYDNYHLGLHMDEASRAGKSHSFGRNQHITLTGSQLSNIVENIAPRFLHYCTHCATEMSATGLTCTTCDTTHRFSSKLKGVDLLQAVSRFGDCSACGSSAEEDPGLFLPNYHCVCGNPGSGGSFLYFDLRLLLVKIEGRSLINIESVRIPMHLDPDTHPALRENIAKMIREPLDLPAIFAPSNLNTQRKVLGQMSEGVDPAPRNAAPQSESYGDSVPYGSSTQE